MAEPCVLSFGAPSGPLRQGADVVIQVTVANTQAIVDHMSLEALGELAPFVTMTPSRVQLLPGTTAEVELRIALPPGSAVPAGPMPFAILARSGTDPSATVVGETAVEVVGAGLIQAELHPVTSSGRRKAKHRIELTNTGNAPVRVRLSADDADELLDLTIEPQQVTVPPGGVMSAQLLLGAGSRDRSNPRLPFTVRVVPGMDPEIQLPGAFRQKGGVPRWLIPVALAAVILAVVLIAFRPKHTSISLEAAAAKKAEATAAAVAAAGGDPAAAAAAAAANGGDPAAAAAAAGGGGGGAPTSTGPAAAATIPGTPPTTATGSAAGITTTSGAATTAATTATTGAPVSPPTTTATTAAPVTQSDFYTVAGTGTTVSVPASSSVMERLRTAPPVGTRSFVLPVTCVNKVSVSVTSPSVPSFALYKTTNGARPAAPLATWPPPRLFFRAGQTGFTAVFSFAGTSFGTSDVVEIVNTSSSATVTFSAGDDGVAGTAMVVPSGSTKSGAAPDLAATMSQASSC